MYRILACLFLACVSAYGADAQPWPLWDGHESIADYAKHANLPPTKTLDLGNGVNLELVLIPAGKSIRGVPEPKEPEEDVLTGQIILVVAGAAAFALVVIIAIRSIHKRRRPQFSLRWLLVFVITLGFAMLGAFRWRDVTSARRRYKLALRYIPYERVAHEVTLTKPFYIGKYEVTQAQYTQMIGTNPSAFKGASLPVEMVSWDDATEFCKKASEKSGQTVRLPTEAEWEHACRAGTSTSYCSGNEDADLGRVGWYEANSNRATRPVGQKEPNAWGVYDMHGNVWEWCADWHEDYQPGTVIDPRGPSQGQCRVLRGGAWYHDPRYCQSTSRYGYTPDDYNHILGFRVAMEVEQQR